MFRVDWEIALKHGTDWKTQWVSMLGIDLGLLDAFNIRGLNIVIGVLIVRGINNYTTLCNNLHARDRCSV